MVALYVGFIPISGWIVYREEPSSALCWSFTDGPASSLHLYTLLALQCTAGLAEVLDGKNAHKPSQKRDMYQLKSDYEDLSSNTANSAGKVATYGQVALW
jgi:hypothetical protein